MKNGNLLPKPMKAIDQMNRQVDVPEFPERIISLVPSQTELLVGLGLSDRMVGVTKFCVHPRGFKEQKAIIGGTKNFHFDKIDALRPDLIIGNKEENYKEGIEQLAAMYPVWVSDICNLEDALQMMKEIGKLTGTEEKCREIVDAISIGFREDLPFKGSAIYLIWQDPMITVGKNTFIDQMLLKAGFENLIEEERYPEITEEAIRRLGPDFILLSSEPYPFRDKHIAKYTQLFPSAKVKLVDGEIFSWYGSRLLQAPGYFGDKTESSCG